MFLLWHVLYMKYLRTHNDTDSCKKILRLVDSEVVNSVVERGERGRGKRDSLVVQGEGGWWARR
jgi:hypothetical protein